MTIQWQVTRIHPISGNVNGERIMRKQGAWVRVCRALLVTVVTGLLPLASLAESSAPPSRPNVLLIITDQQHAGMMSCAGNRWLKTPSLDALAARGVRFERAYCGNPVCVPSRLSMMTGVLPSRIGMEHNELASFPVPDEIRQNALGSVFRNAGYRAVYGGKVHLPGTKKEGIAAYGFDVLTGDEREGLAQPCARNAKTPAAELAPVTCSYREVTGVGLEEGVCRRDPSDVIKVGDTWYVWYTKVIRADLPETWRSLYPSGYPGTIWYATSDDQGRSWRERAQSLALGPPNSFDSFGVFTPNILKYRGRYYLYYTAVRPTPGRDDGVFENNSTNDVTAIGLAVAEHPDRPFRRVSAEPILRPANDRTSFDSYRVDDASLLIRDDKIWLYYKGRNLADGRSGPGRTQMGLAIADEPAGPYVKSHGGRALLPGSHEVLVWQQGEGVTALASISRTLQFATDGIHFQKVADLASRPNAPGAYRRELTEPVEGASQIRWGVSMRHGPHPYLVRFQLARGAETVD